MTTIGGLLSKLCTTYERRYEDERLAALATQVTIDELLRSRHILATGKIA
ncbi:MAG: hypothetical protein ABI678_16155 [Kofleriaceae bacterium]